MLKISLLTMNIILTLKAQILKKLLRRDNFSPQESRRFQKGRRCPGSPFVHEHGKGESISGCRPCLILSRESRHPSGGSRRGLWARGKCVFQFNAKETTC